MPQEWCTQASVLVDPELWQSPMRQRFTPQGGSLWWKSPASLPLNQLLEFGLDVEWRFKKARHKQKCKKGKKKHGTMLSDVDRCGERLPLIGLGKRDGMFLPLLRVLKKSCLVWLVWRLSNVKVLSNSRNDFLKKKKPNLPTSEMKSVSPSCAVLTSETLAL